MCMWAKVVVLKFVWFINGNIGSARCLSSVMLCAVLLGRKVSNAGTSAL